MWRLVDSLRRFRRCYAYYVELQWIIVIVGKWFIFGLFGIRVIIPIDSDQ